MGQSECSFSFHAILWENPNKLFGQPDINNKHMLLIHSRITNSTLHPNTSWGVTNWYVSWTTPHTGNTTMNKADTVCPPGPYNWGGNTDTCVYLVPNLVSEQSDNESYWTNWERGNSGQRKYRKIKELTNNSAIQDTQKTRTTFFSPSCWHSILEKFIYSCSLWYLPSVHFSCSVMSDSLQPHRPKHTRPPCPSPTPGVYPNSCPLSRWCHPIISSSAVPFSSCPQSFPASGSFP